MDHMNNPTTRSPESPMHRIELQNVSYAYPHSDRDAVTNLSLTVDPGELKLVTGASGCGKTTLMRLVNGLAPQILKGRLTGKVLIDGWDASTTPVAALSEHIGTLFQDPEEQFFALNVRDEIAFALQSRGLPADVVEARVARATERLGLAHLLDQDIHALSEGQKQKVGLAGILALEPKALILDEPTAYLDPEATEELAGLLLEWKAAGAAILVVDHRLYWLKDVADEVLVMHEGEIVERGPFAMLADEMLRARWGLRRDAVADPRETLPRVAVTHAGEAEIEPADRSRTASERERFRADALRFAYPGRAAIFEGVSFGVEPGITALVGGNGTGKTTLARILTGLEKAEGRFRIGSRPVGREGLMPFAGLVLQNADHQLQMRTVRDEILGAIRASLSAEARNRKLGFFARRRAVRLTDEHYARADALMRDLRLSHLASRHPQSLSGGEKQRLVTACALAKDPAILILDEPTSGLDGANMAAMAGLLRAEAQKGRAVFLITHDLELLDICDRALDMRMLAAKKAEEKTAEKTAGSRPAAS